MWAGCIMLAAVMQIYEWAPGRALLGGACLDCPILLLSIPHYVLELHRWTLAARRTLCSVTPR